MRTSRSTRQLAIGAVAIFSLACGSDSITAATSVNGTYSLRTINGAALPVTFNGFIEWRLFAAHVHVAFEHHAERRPLGPDHLDRPVRVWPIDEVQTDTSTGTYALSGKQLTFSQPGSTSFTAEWNGSDMLTTVDNGVTFMFRK